jgi:hypothetical protein
MMEEYRLQIMRRIFGDRKDNSRAEVQNGNATILWDMAHCSQYVNRRFGEQCHLGVVSRQSTEQETSVQQVVASKDDSIPNYRCANLKQYIMSSFMVTAFLT